MIWPKKVALVALYCLLSWLLRRRGLTVLTYHRVSRLPDLDDSLKVSANALDHQMRFLRDNYSVLSPTDVSNVIRSRGKFPAKSCLVTFDDGWKDNFDHAFPILKKYDIPALIFLSTGLIGTSRVFWHEQISEVLAQIPNGKKVGLLEGLAKRFSRPLIDRVVEVVLADDSRKGVLIHELVIALKRFDVEHNEALAAALRQTFEVNLRESDHAMLSWDEIAEMAQNGIHFGSHTVSHELLDRLSDDQAQNELVESKRCIEEKVGCPVEFLSYPNGNFTQKTIELAQGAGYVGAFTCVGGKNVDSLSPYELRRLHIRESSSLGFTRKFSDLFFAIDLSGLRNTLNRLRPTNHY